jgi:hypothetical protein
MTKWEPPDYIEFSARRGEEQLHVQVLGCVDHPSDNPQLMAVVLEVRLGPDMPSHATIHEMPHVQS